MHAWLSRFLVVMTGVAFVYVAGSLFLLFDPRGRWTTSWCGRDVRAEAKSPDGMLEARAVEFSCTFGSETWMAVVIVKPRRTPSNEDEVLNGEIAGDGIKLSWNTPDLLEISVSSPNHIFVHKTEHAGVKVDLIRGGIRSPLQR
jgi:hypothetical protein